MKNDLMAYVRHIENYLDGCFDFYEFEPQAVLFDSMRYSLLAGGKRLRPVFVFDFCRMAGGCWPDATPFAAADPGNDRWHPHRSSWHPGHP